MKKIAILNKYQEKVSRGAETFVTELSGRLSKNYSIDVISKINYWKILNAKYDLIIPTNGREQAFLIRIITWLEGSKMIISGQSGMGLDDRLNLYSFPDYFIALSSEALKWAKRINPLTKSIYIPNGVDLSKFTENKKGNLKKIKTILSVGAFTKEKRHDLTIKAVSRLKDVKLVIVGGGGDLRKEIESLGLKLLGENFEIKRVEHSKMPKIYNMADVLAFPTVPWESFGIVLVEAMAANLPVVASNDPIRREIVGDAGLFIDPNDTDKYSEALKDALTINWDNKPRLQSEKFDWDKIAEEYEKIIATF